MSERLSRHEQHILSNPEKDPTLKTIVNGELILKSRLSNTGRIIDLEEIHVDVDKGVPSARTFDSIGTIGEIQIPMEHSRRGGTNPNHNVIKDFVKFTP